MDAIAVVEEGNPALAEFSRRDFSIKELAAKYMPLKINGLKDRAGFNAVHAARMEVKMVRVGVEKTRKELKAAVLEYGRAVDSEAARLSALIEPVEAHLIAEENAIEMEKQRIRLAEEDARRARVQERCAAFTAVNTMPPLDIADMTEEAFSVALTTAKAAWAERERLAALEAQRLANEAEARRIEREALDKQRAEQEAIRQQQEENLAKLRAEQQRLDNERAAQARAVELEKVRKDAAERAAIETEERMKREAEQKRLAEVARQEELKAEQEAAELERRRIESEKPIREKILALADAIEAFPIPMDGVACTTAKKILKKAAAEIRKIMPLE